MKYLAKERHVVIIFPHPDDESFGTAGLIKQYREEGVPVTYLCGTLGEMGRNMGTPPFANRETLSKIREKELADACDFLDIDYRLLGYRDKTIEFEKKTKVALHIKEIIEEINPSLVITHYPEHGVHPDHNALGEATVEAVEMMAEETRPVLWASAITHYAVEELGEPDIIRPVKDFNYKIQAILKHKSQAEGMLKKLQGDEAELSDYLAGLQNRLGTERFHTWNFR